jgi:hypothetical protein
MLAVACRCAAAKLPIRMYTASITIILRDVDHLTGKSGRWRLRSSSDRKRGNSARSHPPYSPSLSPSRSPGGRFDARVQSRKLHWQPQLRERSKFLLCNFLYVQLETDDPTEFEENRHGIRIAGDRGRIWQRKF